MTSVSNRIATWDQNMMHGSVHALALYISSSLISTYIITHWHLHKMALLYVNVAQSTWIV